MAIGVRGEPFDCFSGLDADRPYPEFARSLGGDIGLRLIDGIV